MQSNHARAVLQIPRVFVEHGAQAELRAHLQRGIREHSATSEALLWLCKERAGEWRALANAYGLQASAGFVLVAKGLPITRIE